MAKIVSASYGSIFCRCACIILVILLSDAKSNVVFQPASYLVASRPTLSAFLLGNTTGISLILRTISPSNSTGRLPPPSCSDDPTQWVITREMVGKTIMRVHLSLNRSLHLCGNNDTETDCCPAPLCVLETLRVSACLGDLPQATLLIQAKIYAQLLPTGPVSDNKTVIPNQVYQPLGPCPCDLTVGACDIRCCCDMECSPEAMKLFESQCLRGPFGGDVSSTADYQCSTQSYENAPDWFPFLCVISPPDNNPFLGLFYQGEKITPKPSPSFASPVLSAPLSTNDYRQGGPIFTTSDQYFTIPQNSLAGQCIDNAPVAFLENFLTQCVTLLLSCPNGPPLQTTTTSLRVQVMDGQGGVVTVDVIDEMAVDLIPFVSSPAQVVALDPAAPLVSPEHVAEDKRQLCENVTLALDYKFFWRGNSLTNITLTRTVGNVPLDTSVALTSRYSAVFLNGDATAEPRSGNPGYQVGRPVIGGIVDTMENNTGAIQRTSINLWKPVSDGFCESADMRPVLFGENSTAGCLLPVNLQNLTQCSQLRETVYSLQAALVTTTHVARSGDPDFLNLADWLNITFVTLNSSQPGGGTTGSCFGVPSYLHIHVRSIVTGVVEGMPQREIQALEVSYSVSTWRLECGGGDPTPCLNPMVTQSFPVTSSITFTDIPTYTGPPKTRFQINFTEYDCDRNDVCWPQLAFPLTRYYTGEPHSQSLAKGLILVFCFIAASILGTPWKQIRQAWSSASL